MESTATNNVPVNTTATTIPTPQEYVDLADKTYLDFIKAGRYTDIVNSMTTLGNYSLRNQMLILNQLPSATKVNSMNGWNFNKRNIQKGSKSIKILAPVFESIVTVNDGQIVEKKSDKVTKYNLNHVFDISQTIIKENQTEETENLDIDKDFNKIALALQGTLKSYEFNLADIADDGKLDTRNRTVTIKDGLSKEQTLKTLINQVAGALVIGRDRQKFQGLKSDILPNATAIEITAVAAIVSKRLGLESAQKVVSPEFEKLSDEQIDKFSHNINVIRSISQIMVLAIDNALVQSKASEKSAEAKAEEVLEPITPETEVTAKTTVKTATKTTTKTNAQAEMA